MDAASTPPQPDTAGAWWRAAAVLAWIAGIALQLQQPALWASAAYPLIGASALAGWLAAGRCRWRGVARLGIGIALAAAGFAYAGWRADVRLADALAAEWEGCDIELVGVIDEMPQVAEDGLHFAFVVESARVAGMTGRELKRVQSLDSAAGRPLDAAIADAEAMAGRARASNEAADDDDVDPASVAAPPPGPGSPVVPSRVWLAWSRNQRDDRAVAASPAPLRAGQRWRLPVRLRRPHGALNPDGFDGELWLFDQDLRATGAVRGNGQLLDARWAPIENARQWVRDRLLLGAGTDAGDAAAAGALAALAVGDQAAIDGFPEKNLSMPIRRKSLISINFSGLSAKRLVKRIWAAIAQRRADQSNRVCPRAQCTGTGIRHPTVPRRLIGAPNSSPVAEQRFA